MRFWVETDKTSTSGDFVVLGVSHLYIRGRRQVQCIILTTQYVTVDRNAGVSTQNVYTPLMNTN